MKNFIKEFKTFCMRGNVVDMAVGIIIGSAFTAIVSSLVEDIISPLIGIFGTANLNNMSCTLKEGVTLYYGNFIASIINFVLVAFVLFILIKSINLIRKDSVGVSSTKICPHCKTSIPKGATRCPNCTSELDA